MSFATNETAAMKMVKRQAMHLESIEIEDISVLPLSRSLSWVDGGMSSFAV